MRIIKEKSREYKGNPYFKYKINLPEGAIQRAELKEGDELEVTATPEHIFLQLKKKSNHGFGRLRSRLYKQALQEYPTARIEELNAMKDYFKPLFGEKILELGAGSGFFSKHISERIGNKGKLIVTDPSLEQLEEIKRLERKNIEVIQFAQFGSQKISLTKNSIDGVWSFAAMHHMMYKSKYFEHMHKILKKGGRVVVGDVFSSSKTALWFDKVVAQYSISGHDAAFLTKEYVQSLCCTAKFTPPIFYDLNLCWRFKNKKEIGLFLYKLHAMTKITPEKCLVKAQEILGIEKRGKRYYLNWSITIFTTKKM